MDKETVMIEVLNHLRKSNIQSAVNLIMHVEDPRTAAWIGMGVMFVIGDDSSYAAVLEGFRTQLERANSGT